MKQPRLRSTVTYVSTAAGVLIRNGDSFLPINGAGAWASFQSILPLLEGRTLAAEQRRELLARLEGPLAKLCDALRNAGMLYTPEDDECLSLSENLRARFAPEIAAIELKSDDPVETFARIRSKQILIISSRNLAVPVIEAAFESGLANIVLLSEGLTPEDQSRLEQIISSYAENEAHLRVEPLTSPSSLREFQECDVLMLAGNPERDRALLNRASHLMLHSREKFGMALYVGKDRVVTSVCDPEVSCDACIKERVVGDSISAASQGTRMLLRHFWEVQSENSWSLAEYTMMEMSLRDHRIRRKPRPHRTTCRAHQAFLRRPTSFVLPRSGSEPNRISALEFCKRAEAICVDEESGILRFLDEGELLQYPRHQCAARLAEECQGTEQGWLVECGEDMVEARTKTIRSALEWHYEKYFSRSVPNPNAAPQYSASGEMSQPRGRIHFADGVVVSGSSWDEIVTQGLFRALAKTALHRNAWKRIDSLPKVSFGSETELLKKHLEENGDWHAIDVYEQKTTLPECSTLRFDFAGETISVVAGTDWNLAWRIGIEDVWMHLQRRKLPTHGCSANDLPVRFRAAIMKEAEPSLIAELEKHLAIDLCLFPIATEKSMNLLSLSFMYCCFAEISRKQLAELEQEESAILAIARDI